jgi:hypothetical protein
MRWLLVSCQCPLVLNKILPKSIVSWRSRISWCIRRNSSNINAPLQPLVMEDITTLIINDHVVHDHTSGHHLRHVINASYSSRVPKNSPLGLEHTKFQIHIFPTSLLLLRKHHLFSLLRKHRLSTQVWTSQDICHRLDNCPCLLAWSLIS